MRSARDKRSQTPPDTQHLGLLERTIIGVNNVYFDIAATLRDRFWGSTTPST